MQTTKTFEVWVRKRGTSVFSHVVMPATRRMWKGAHQIARTYKQTHEMSTRQVGSYRLEPML